MSKYIVWLKPIVNKQVTGLYKIAETEEHLSYIKEQMGGEDYFNTWYETTITTDEIFNGLQEGTRSFESGTKENPIWVTGFDGYKTSYDWWVEADFIIHPIKIFIQSNPHHVLNEQLSKWVYYVSNSKGNALNFTYPHNEHNVTSYCKTLLNPDGKPADAVRDIAFSPLQLP